MKLMYLFMSAIVCVTLLSCSSDSTSTNTSDTPEKTYFKATANGSGYTSMMTNVSGGPDSYSVTANNGSIAITMTVKASEGTTDAKGSFTVMFANGSLPKIESANEGSIVVTKVTSTQVKGTFSAKTDTYDIKDGSFVIDKK